MKIAAPGPHAGGSPRLRLAKAPLRHAGWLLVPVSFAIFPLLSLFQQNETEVELGVLWWPLALCIAGAAAVYGLLLGVFRRPAKASVLASLIVFWFL